MCYNTFRKDDMMDCIFCKIVNNEIPSLTIYEDDLIKVFLDINPTTNGDLLVIPKKHYTNILDIDKNLWNHLLEIIQKFYPILKEKLGCEGLTLVQNNEYGQEIKHFHLHLTPRYSNDHIKNESNKEILVDINDVFEQLKN